MVPLGSVLPRPARRPPPGVVGDDDATRSIVFFSRPTLPQRPISICIGMALIRLSDNALNRVGSKSDLVRAAEAGAGQMCPSFEDGLGESSEGAPMQ
jgi:hypothetical protein